ncbi:MAG TPA: hypothetical protein VF992_01310 [Thermoplasmata archaeon]
MTPRTEAALRWFVGLSLVGGSLALLTGAIEFGQISGSPWAVVSAAALAVVLALVSIVADQRPWPAMAPAAGWILSVLLAILWAHLDPLGHAFLSGYAPLVALATGIGFLRRRFWAWPVAFASAAGFGPIVLVLANLPTAIVASGFALFVVDVVALLALSRTYLEPR